MRQLLAFADLIRVMVDPSSTVASEGAFGAPAVAHAASRASEQPFKIDHLWRQPTLCDQR